MDYPSKKIKYNFCLLFIFIYTFSYCQNTLKGSWKPQKYTETCWGATLSNVSRVAWVNNQIDEDYFEMKAGKILSTSTDYRSDIYLNTYKKLIGLNYKYRRLFNNRVLTYEAINHYLRYKYPRPLIYGFNYEDDRGGGHFTNIIGCDSSKNIKKPHRYWLKIFDPKPDQIGTNYLKNYESYQRITNQNTLQSTFFNITGTKNRPSILLDSITHIRRDLAKTLTRKNCQNCIDEKNLFNTISTILTDNIFKDYIGTFKKIPENFKKILVYDLSDSLEAYNGLSTIKKESETYLIITNNNTNDTLGGILLRKYSKKYLIERVENLNKYKEFEGYFLKPNIKFLILKNSFRFIEFSENGNLKFADLDNLLEKNSDVKKIYSFNEFKIALKPNFAKITESAKLILKACQKIIDMNDLCMINEGGNNLGFGRFFLPANMKSSEYFIEKLNIKDSLTYILSKDIYKAKERLQYFSLFFRPADTLRNESDKYIKCKKYKLDNYNSFNDNSFSNINQLFFIPISVYHNIISPNSKSLDSLAKYGVTIEKIEKIGTPRIEHTKGFMNDISNDINNYNNNLATNGIICDLLLKNKTVVTCYLINRIYGDIISKETKIPNIKWKE
jgi:hypothetical protein